MNGFISATDVKELLIGLDSLPWEEEIDDIIKPLIETDVKKVIHGKWIDGMKCSECGQIDWSKPDYCSSCGTKMDLM